MKIFHYQIKLFFNTRVFLIICYCHLLLSFKNDKKVLGNGFDFSIKEKILFFLEEFKKMFIYYIYIKKNFKIQY